MKSISLRTVVQTAVATFAMAAFVASANATPITVGDFSTSSHSSNQLTTNAYNGATLSNWSNPTQNAYNFVFVPGDTTANNQYGSGLTFYGNTSGPNSPFVSPKGGNVVALDSDFGQGNITQTLHGLTTGDLVTLTFDFAGAQQTGFSGASTDYLAVSLGGQTIDTQTLNNASQSFTGWNSESLTFTATGTSEVLSFFAVGTPSGVPSFALLDNVSGTETPNSPVPEPGSLALLSTGLIGLGGFVRSRFNKA
jgi:hypothetical protein